MATSLGICGDQGMRANFTMSLQSLFKEMGFENTSNGSTALVEILEKTGMDLGLPINLSFGSRAPHSLIGAQGFVKSDMLDASSVSSGVRISLDSSTGSLLVPKEVVSSVISKYFITGAAAFAEFTVIDTVSAPQGKWPMAFGNVVAIEANQIAVFLEEMVQAAFSSDTFKEILTNDLYPFGALTEVIAKKIRERFLTLLKELQIEATASIVGIQMNNRTNAYTATGQTARQSLAQFTDSIRIRIGADSPVTLISPLLEAFEELNFLQIFLYQFFAIIVLGVTAAGCFVLWTVAFSEVQELTYISSIMRTLGLSKTILSRFHMLVSIRHSLFGTLVGATLTAIGVAIITDVLSRTISVTPRRASVTAILVAILLGAVFPTIGSLLPSRRAFTKSLKPQDIAKEQRDEEFTIVVHRLKDVGCNIWVFSASFLLTLYGAAFYFFLPRSFLEENYALFFAIMNLSMTGLVVGLVIIFQSIQETIQHVLVYIFILLARALHLLRGVVTLSERCLLSFLLRNMKSHRKQNRNAAWVLSLSAAILILCGSFTQLQVNGMSDSVRELLGSDIVLYAKDRSQPLNETHLRVLLSNFSTHNAVKKFSFITFPLSRKVQIMSVAEWPRSESLYVYGIDDEFFETIFEDITHLSETQAHSVEKKSLYALLQTHTDGASVQRENSKQPSCISKTGRRPRQKGIIPPDEKQPWIYNHRSNSIHVSSKGQNGSEANKLRNLEDEGELPSDKIPGLTNYPMALVMSEAFREVLSADTSTALQIKMKSLSLVARASIMAQKLPSFFFSRFSSTLSSSPILVSDRNFRRLSAILDTGWTFEQNPSVVEKVSLQAVSPKQRLLIRLNSNSSQRIVREQIRMLRSDDVIVRDVEENLSEVQKFEKILGTVYAGVAITLSFLASSMLWVVFYQNAKDSTWTIALSRAIGLTNGQVLKIQLYESFSVTIFGICSGTGIGFLGTFALVMQDELFWGVRQTISFPFFPFSILSFLSSLTALLSSLFSWKKLVRSETATLMRHSEY